MVPDRLKGKVVVVTGGGGGIGRALTAALSSEGASVAVIDVDAEAAKQAIAGTRYENGRHLAIRADLQQIKDCEVAIAQVVDRFGVIDGLLNNAGLGMTAIRADYLDRPVRFWEVETDRWQRLMDVNVRAAFVMARAAVPHMLARGSGRIVNITTSLDTMYRAGYTPYGPSKAWLEAATVSWARDLEGTGVTCNALIPGGAVNSGFFDKNAPLDRASLIQPEVMSPPACWLMSAESGGVTGRRFVAREWNADLADEAAAEKAGSAGAWQSLGSQSLWPSATPVR